MRRWNVVAESALSSTPAAAMSAVSGLSRDVKPKGHSSREPVVEVATSRARSARVWPGSESAFLTTSPAPSPVVAVAGDEGALVAVEVRDDDPDRDGEVGDAASAVTISGRQRTLAHREVRAHDADDQRHRLLAGGRQHEERQRPQPAVLLDVQERPEQERRRQSHGVELVEHQKAERPGRAGRRRRAARRRAGHA